MFGAVSLTKNADIDKYKYSGYGIGFDRHGEFSFGNALGKICIIFGAELSSSSSHANNKKNNILVLGKDFVQRINGITIYAEKLYKINFTEKKLVIYLLMVQKSISLKQKILCLGNISKDFSVDNMKKIELNGYVYDFSVDYDAIAVDDILDIHKYLMGKNGIV